jgi:hypothetical protein
MNVAPIYQKPAFAGFLHFGGSEITIIMVDPDGGTQARTWTTPDPNFKPTLICAQLDKPVHAEADGVLRDGKPYLLFGMWDYGKDCVQVTEAERREVLKRTHLS